MQGILIMDKPAGFTSFDVVAKLRGIFGIRKIGHSGTLDPMATGVLPVFIGNAAKAVDLQTNHDKVYEAELLLGTRTDTGDVTGAVLEIATVSPQIDAAAVAAVLPRFLGESEQLPPMYSAVKVNGRALYKAARAGQTVERKPRPISIYALTLLEQLAPCRYRIRISCGKGTYVRVLLEEIGRALGVPATMAALQRTRAGAFSLAQAHSFAQVEQAKAEGRLAELLVPLESVFEAYKPLEVTQEARLRLEHGASVWEVPAANGVYRLRCGGVFLGLGSVQSRELRAQKLFVERD